MVNLIELFKKIFLEYEVSWYLHFLWWLLVFAVFAFTFGVLMSLVINGKITEMKKYKSDLDRQLKIEMRQDEREQIAEKEWKKKQECDKHVKKRGGI